MSHDTHIHIDDTLHWAERCAADPGWATWLLTVVRTAAADIARRSPWTVVATLRRDRLDIGYRGSARTIGDVMQRDAELTLRLNNIDPSRLPVTVAASYSELDRT